jgi:flagellar biosynthesis protein FlhG
MKNTERIIVEPRPFIITVCSGKGGVGKSIVTSNLSYKLAEKGLRTLVWDADSQFPNQHLIFGVEPPIRASNCYSGHIPVDKAIHKLGKNLYLLADMPAPGLTQYYSDTFIIDTYQSFEESEEYDIIIFDTPAGAGTNVLQCAAIADLIVVMVTDEPTSLLDAYALIKIFLQNINIKKLCLLVNNVIDDEDATDVSTKLNLATAKFLKQKYEYLGYIPYNREVRHSLLAQELFIKKTGNTEMLESFKKIVNNIVNKLNFAEI